MITDDQKQEILVLVKSGILTYAQIGKKYGVTKQMIAQIVSSFGLKSSQVRVNSSLNKMRRKLAAHVEQYDVLLSALNAMQSDIDKIREVINEN